MSNHATNFRFPECGRGGYGVRRVVAVVSLVVACGCRSGSIAFLPLASVEIITGKDDAGATIELEKRGDELTAARVIDVILGTGEAEIVSNDNVHIEFTIDFQAGVAITYRGRTADSGNPGDVTISGTWHQHAGGVFGGDFGTWEAQSRLGRNP